MPKKNVKIRTVFTSMETARFMSGLYNFDEKTGKVSVLDAGAGSGILSCAFIERVETIDSIQMHQSWCFVAICSRLRCMFIFCFRESFMKSSN